MKVVSLANARRDLDELHAEVTRSAEPIQIDGPRGEAVLVSAAEWRSLQETLYLTSIPGMKESLLAAMNAPDSEFSEELDWGDGKD